MNYIKCQVVTDDEIFVGHADLFALPRVGEYIWFSEERLGHRSWVVKEVAHHVGSGEFGAYTGGYQSVVVYAVPTVDVQTKYYLVHYEFKNKGADRFETANAALDVHPVVWLRERVGEHLENQEQYRITNWIEIDKDHYDLINGWID